MKSYTFESSFSDYHKVVTIILRKTICNDNPKTIYHMSYMNISYMNDATYRSNFFLILNAFS